MPEKTAEKPNDVWPMPEGMEVEFSHLKASLEEIGEVMAQVAMMQANHAAKCMHVWSEAKEKLVEMFPDDTKNIFGAVKLHWNEDTGQVESWNPGQGPFADEIKEEYQGKRTVKVVINPGGDGGGTINDMSKKAGDELFGRGAPDLGLAESDDEPEDFPDGLPTGEEPDAH